MEHAELRQKLLQKEKLLLIAKLAKEMAEVCSMEGDCLGRLHFLDIADYVSRKAKGKRGMEG